MSLKKILKSMSLVALTGLMLVGTLPVGIYAQEPQAVKFSFGMFSIADAKQVTEKIIYTKELGYGFEAVEDIKSVEIGCVSEKPIIFKVDLPNGVYNVNVLVGNTKEALTLTTRMNGILKMQDTKYLPNKDAAVINKSTFLAGVYDGQMVFNFTGKPTTISGLEIEKRKPMEKGKFPTIFIAGDSTVQTYTEREFPQAGWGQMLSKYMKSEIKIANRAIGGRSTRNFTFEGRYDAMLAEAKAGDYIFIQFAHNDASKGNADRFADAETDYKEYLRRYIDGARELEIAPILVTPMGRRSIGSDGDFKHDFGNYVNSMKAVAEEKKVTVLNLAEKSIELYNSYGAEGSKELFLHVQPGGGPKFTKGSADNTHFKIEGATKIAELVSEEIGEKITELTQYVLSNPDESATLWSNMDNVSIQPTNQGKTFEDIAEHWSKKDVERMVSYGIVNGVSESSFEPNKNVSRAEFLAIVSRIVGLKSVEYNKAYSDVTSEQWFAGLVQAAKDAGVVDANMTPENMFKPSESITREEMFTFIIGAYKYYYKLVFVPGQGVDFKDSKDVTPWAVNDVKAAYFFGMIKGSEEGTFSPLAVATRAEAVVMASRLFNLINK